MREADSGAVPEKANDDEGRILSVRSRPGKRSQKEVVMQPRPALNRQDGRWCGQLKAQATG